MLPQATCKPCGWFKHRGALCACIDVCHRLTSTSSSLCKQPVTSSVSSSSDCNYEWCVVWCVISLRVSEDLGAAAFFPGMAATGMAADTWTGHPLAAAYADLAPPPGALHPHPTLIQHPALAQVPVRVSLSLPYDCTACRT